MLFRSFNDVYPCFTFLQQCGSLYRFGLLQLRLGRKGRMKHCRDRHQNLVDGRPAKEVRSLHVLARTKTQIRKEPCRLQEYAKVDCQRPKFQHSGVNVGKQRRKIVAANYHMKTNERLLPEGVCSSMEYPPALLGIRLSKPWSLENNPPYCAALF